MDAITPPRRRNIKQMTENIAAHTPGAVWTVQFRSPLFGVYCVYGPVQHSPTIDELRIGLALITVAGANPSRYITNIWTEPPGFTEHTGRSRDPLALQHGAVVRAKVSPFGEKLTVIGHAIGQRMNRALAVGHHHIRTDSGVAPNLVSLTELRESSSNTPDKIYAWSDFDDPLR